MYTINYAVTRRTEATVNLHMETLFSEDYLVYLQQTGQRQLDEAPIENITTARWLTLETDNPWLLDFPLSLSPPLLFDLLQLGSWIPGNPLRITGSSIAQAIRRGYDETRLIWLLEQATGIPLSRQRRLQLSEWRRQATSYQIRQMLVLETAQSSQMKPVLQRASLRKWVLGQLSPRHVAVRPDMVPALQRWLDSQDIHLTHGVEAVEQADWLSETSKNEAAYGWLAVQVLIELHRLIPLPITPPYWLLEPLAARLTPIQQNELASLATQIMEGIRESIRGRDAFLPANQPVLPELVAAIQHAIAGELEMVISYQTLGEPAPRQREVQPLSLAQQGTLYYMKAYCYLAEAERTFRLDRITDWAMAA